MLGCSGTLAVEGQHVLMGPELVRSSYDLSLYGEGPEGWAKKQMLMHMSRSVRD